MKTRVAGRVRSAYKGGTYTIEMRADGMLVRRLHGRTPYEVPFEHVLELVKSCIDKDAVDRREGRNAKLVGIRRAARDKGQTMFPFDDALIPTATRPPSAEGVPPNRAQA